MFPNRVIFTDLNYDDVDGTILGKGTSAVCMRHVSVNINMYFMGLGESDAFDVKSAVMDVAARYYFFGGALGLSPTKLAQIREDNRNSEQALSQVINVWLKQCFNVERFGLPSWRMLVVAVDSRAGGGNHALAKKIAYAHPGSGVCMLRDNCES